MIKPEIFAPGEQPLGRLWADWTVQWCKWLFSIPADSTYRDT
jgi:hypothetical protein